MNVRESFVRIQMPEADSGISRNHRVFENLAQKQA